MSFKSRNFEKTSWFEESLRFNTSLISLSSSLKKILVFNSSPIVVGIVGRLLFIFEFTLIDFSLKLELFGSYFKQKFKYLFLFVLFHKRFTFYIKIIPYLDYV